MKKHTFESDLAEALFQFSWGRLTIEEASEMAHKVAPNIDMNNGMLAHKGVNWCARQILATI